MSDFTGIIPEHVRRCAQCAAELLPGTSTRKLVCSEECRRERGRAYSRRYSASARRVRADVLDRLGLSEPAQLVDPEIMKSVIEQVRSNRRKGNP